MTPREIDPREGAGTTGTRPETGAPGARGVREHEDRPVKDLVRELANEGSDLVRQELALARAEMHEKVETYQSAATRMATGGALVFAGLLFFLWALNMGMTALLAQWMGLDIASWLAPVVLAVVLGGIGYGLLKGGQSTMREEGLTPEKTRDSLRTDRSWVRTRARRFREAGRHE